MKFPNLEMARQKPNDPQQKPEAKQEEAREAYKARLNRVLELTESDLKEYKKAIQDGDFEDKDDEGVGSGEKRKEAFQKKILSSVGRAEKMKEILDSGEEIPKIDEEIQVEYIYKNPQTGKVETQESITLSIEEKIQSFINFYQKTDIDLQPDFEERIREIWQRNNEGIKEAIEKCGFDGILLVPRNIPLAELAEKLKMQNGYYFYQVKEDFSDVKSQGVDKPRIILYHKTTLPEIQKKTGLDIHLNITGGDAEKLLKQNPGKYLSTLEDHLILERKNFDESGEHLSDYKKSSAVWLPGTKVGSRFVDSCWDPDDGELYVDADDAGHSYSRLGCRPSRYFV